MTSNPKRSLEGRALLENITWEWQVTSDVFERVMRTVDPGTALRTYKDRFDKDRLRKAQTRLGPRGTPKPELSEDEKFRSGARTILADRLHGLREAGLVESRQNNDVRYVRRVERRAGSSEVTKVETGLVLRVESDGSITVVHDRWGVLAKRDTVVMWDDPRENHG